MTDLISCPWCTEQADIGGLVGVHQSCCPVCGKAVLPAPFGKLQSGSYFLSDLGGKWEKVSASDALCVDGEASCLKGDFATFTEDAPVYPFLLADLYPMGECPDCGEDIPDEAIDGATCDRCGHAFFIASSGDAAAVSGDA